MQPLTASSPNIVLDAFALVEWAGGLPKAGEVRRILEASSAGILKAYVSWINLGESAYMLTRKRSRQDSERFVQSIPILPIIPVLPSAEDILEAATLKSNAKISFADAFAVKLAQKLSAELVTGDPEIRALGIVPVIWVGP